MKRFWKRDPKNVHELKAEVTSNGEMPASGVQLQRHLIDRIIAELEDGDIDGARHAAIRFRGLLDE